MRCLRFAAFSIGLGSMTIVNAATGSPSTQPSRQAMLKVLVEPFVPVDPQESVPALTVGVAAHLRSTVARQGWAPVSGTDACDDPAAARSLGQSAGAQVVIYGSYQIVDARVRYDGGIVDVATGNVITGLTVTGDIAGPFECQNKLAAQVAAGLCPADPAPPLALTAQAPPTIRPAYAPLAAMLDRNRTSSNEFAERYQRSTDRQTYYPSAFGYGYGGAFGYGGFGLGVFGPGAVIGGTDYSGFGFLPFANARVGYGIGGSAPP